MKQFILSYKDFLNHSKLQEAVLTPEQDLKYSTIQVIEKVKKIHTNIFNEFERLYIPFDFSIFNRSEKSSTQLEIENLLNSNQFEIVSYSQNQCKKQNDSRITKIGKVLVSKKINRPDLAIAYGKDVESTRGVLDTSDMCIVFSRNYKDIATMSTGRSWDSCQNLEYGDNDLNKYVAKDLEQGSIIAYLTKNTDKEIEDPEARILIKPFINIKDEKDIVLLPSTKVYYRGKGFDDEEGLVEKYPKFSEFVMSWCKSIQPNIRGTYKMNNIVYPDGERILKFLTPEEKEILNNPITKEDFKFAFKHYNLDTKYMKFDSKGLITYNTDINFYNKSLEELPICFKNLKSIKGSLILSDCKNLKDLKNLENLLHIQNNLRLDGSGITSLDGLKSLETIGSSLNLSECKNFDFLDFEPLLNISSIGTLILHEIPINNLSFSGLENCEINEIFPYYMKGYFYEYMEDYRESME